jgi:hypothetical protein
LLVVVTKPWVPTATHVVELGQLTPSQVLSVPYMRFVCNGQVVPPSVVIEIAPGHPTATHMLVVGQLIAPNWSVVPRVFAVQLPPPLCVTRRVLPAAA